MASLAAAPTRRIDVCPYRGLEAFESEHAEFYFGREGEIQRLVESLTARAFLAVVGPSGSGKSSLVRAGLIPALTDGQLPGSRSWHVNVLKPGPHPISTLGGQIARLRPSVPINRTVDLLFRDERALNLVDAELLAACPNDAKIVWIIDQFEEVFTLCSDEREREQFISNILYAADPSGQTIVVLTMRADLYHHFAAYPALAGTISAGQLLVGPMDREDLRRAIEGPASKVGLLLEDGLTERLLDGVECQPGPLPVLEHTLLSLWERRIDGKLTHRAYEEIGELAGGLTRWADQAYESLRDEHRHVARRLLTSLVRIGEDSEAVLYSRRRLSLTDLWRYQGQRETLNHVIERFTRPETRLLVTTGDLRSGDTTIEIIHDALLERWQRFQAWLDDDRRFLAWHEEMERDANRWIATSRLDPRRRDREHLLRGTRLNDAVSLLERRPADVSPTVQEYIDAGQRSARFASRVRILMRVATFVFTVVILSIVLAGWLVYGTLTLVSDFAQDLTPTRMAPGNSNATIATQITPLPETVAIPSWRNLQGQEISDRSARVGEQISSRHLIYRSVLHQSDGWTGVFFWRMLPYYFFDSYLNARTMNLNIASKQQLIIVMSAAQDDTLELGLKDTSGSEQKPLLRANAGWSAYRVPLDSFDRIDRSKIELFVIGHSRGNRTPDQNAFTENTFEFALIAFE